MDTRVLANIVWDGPRGRVWMQKQQNEFCVVPWDMPMFSCGSPLADDDSDDILNFLSILLFYPFPTIASPFTNLYFKYFNFIT